MLAYGNLFETESYLSSPLSTPITSPHFEPIKAQGFDALDRLTDTLTTEVCADQFGTGGNGAVLCPPTVERQLTTYDADGEYGLLSSVENANLTSLANTEYDADGRLIDQTASGTTPYRSYVYDADGNATSIENAVGTRRGRTTRTTTSPRPSSQARCRITPPSTIATTATTSARRWSGSERSNNVQPNVRL